MPSPKQHSHHQASSPIAQTPSPPPRPSAPVTISSLLSGLPLAATSPPPITVHTVGLAPKRSSATASPSPTQESQPSPEGAGPLSGAYVIPPRPKPGRKPAKDEPASKRKAQNRSAQQKFRAKKVQRLEELTIQLQGVQEENQRLHAESRLREARMKELEMELQQARELQNTTARERDYWRSMHSTASEFQAAEVLQSQFSRKGSSSTSSVRELETDFTGYRTPDTIMDVSCGGCTPTGHCACVAEYTKLG
ncbi:unnamed protein product [Periconia digitata]|uniref:BZIP domain-containing protein n=1 Tax=Periconia digitata TaxID=1303443 RepID=A0A9W4UJT9_9PLEO|nr:unnamed protein product [Periconia digitata]